MSADNPYYVKWRDMAVKAVTTKYGVSHPDDVALARESVEETLDAIWPEIEQFIHAIDELHSCWEKPKGDDYEDIDDEARKTVLSIHTALHHPELRDSYDF
jgi:hypothetical protein